MRRKVSKQYLLMTDQKVHRNGMAWKLFCILPVFLMLSLLGFANDPPVAINDEDYGPEGLVQTGNVGDNDSDPNGDELNFVSVVEPTQGSWTLNSDGTYSYQPNALYVGFDYATYEVCDPEGLCVQAVIEFGMTFVNYPPVAGNDEFFGIVDTPIIGDVTGNDVELNIEPVFFNVLTQPLHAASFTFNIDGTFSYTPEPGYLGNDLFIYRMCDPCGSCDFATVNLEIVAPNPTPIAGDDSAFVPEDQTLNASVAANDEDSEGDELSFNLLTEPAHGVLTFNANGTYTYVPTHDYYGPDSFTYEACDPYNQCDDATVSITVNFINDPPVAAPDYFDVNEDESVSGSVALNDFDADDEPLEWMIWLQPVNGDLIWDEDTGEFTYTPDPNFSGTDQVSYFMLDPCGETSLAILYFTILEVNDLPVVIDDSETIDEDTTLDATLAANDSDIDSETLEYTVLVDAVSGDFTLNNDGTYSYTPDPNFFGTENITYTVSDLEGGEVVGNLTITVEPVNDPPSVENESFQLNEDDLLAAEVASNDEDIEGVVLNYEFFPLETSGVFNGYANGDFDYTPDPNFYGTIEVAYQACDESICADGLLTIEVISVNDSPVASDANFSTDEDQSLSGDLSSFSSDIEDSNLAFQLIAFSSEGGDVTLNLDGTVDFVPEADFFGDFAFTYEICDSDDSCVEASVTIVIEPINDAPIAVNDEASLDEDGTLNLSVVGNDSDIDDTELSCEILIEATHGSAVISLSGELTYTPAPDFFGTEVISYSLCDDGGACDEATVEITVNPINDAPVAVNDEIGVLMNETLNASVANNDFDIDSEDLSFEALNDVSNGVFTMNSNGTYTYTPDTDFVGFETITYQVCDGSNDCATADLEIEVVNTNEAPVAVDDEFQILEDQFISSGDLAFNDFDPNDDILDYSIVNGPIVGVADLSPNGILTYYPNPNFYGNILIEYQACDQFNVCSSAFVYITVTSVNDMPIAEDDYETAAEDVILNGTVSGNDYDVDDDNLIYTTESTSDNGELIMNEDGSYTFIPTPNFYGQIEFAYQVCDGNGACTNALLNIEVLSINDAPTTINDEFLITYSDVLDADVSVNDSDVDSENLSFELIGTPQNGTIDFNEDGSFIYTPNNEFLGTESLEYSVCDEELACTLGLLIITVEAPNLAPVLSAFSEEICAVQEFVLNLDDIISDDQTPIANLVIAQLQASEGETSLSGHILTYTAIANGSEVVTINYTICDQGVPNLCTEGVLELQIQTAYNPIVNISMVNDVTCNGDANGSIILEIQDQELVESITWNNDLTGAAIENLEAGSYTATIVMDLACSIILEETFVVGGPEALEISGLEALPINDTPGGASDFEVSGGSEPYSFVWTDSDGETISESELLELDQVENAGDYTLTVTDDNDCVISQLITITDLDELSDLDFSIYPNPANDVLNVLLPLNVLSNLTFEIIDARGRIVMNTSLVGIQNLLSINVSSLESGIYILQLSDGSVQSSERFIKNQKNQNTRSKKKPPIGRLFYFIFIRR